MSGRKKQIKALEKWLGIYKEWKQSGESRNKYCTKKGLQVKEFSNKQKQLFHHGLIARQKTRGIKPKFQEIKIEVVKGEVLETEPEIEKALVYCEINFMGSGKVIIERKEGLEKFKSLISELKQDA